ncbi:MAG: outer membrane protein transport protein, partial [Candidatus Celaenobacter polaris]|nr:outer membrane protein transport protein [Candidatus Celaenobacter polaris]
MKKGLLVLFLISIFAVSSLFANGLSLNSIGPRALGMGGAMVGLADDPTAIYWNPAGLAGQNSSLYAFGTDIIPFGTYKFAPYGIDAKTKTNHYASPNLFANYSMGNLAFGLGIYVPAGLGAEYNGDDLTMLSNGYSLEWKSKIAVIDIAPTIAYKINDMFSIGVTGNIFYGMFDMDRPSNYTDIDTSVTPPDTSYLSYQYSESSTGTGFGVSGGLLCKLSDNIQFGASVRTEIKVTMSGEAENGLMPLMGYPETSDFDRDVAWPLWAAFGVAVKPMENLTITADAQYSQWAKSEDQFKTKFKDATWAYVTGLSGDDTFVLDWKDCTQLRFGLEYMASEKLALRAGYYYDPAPAPDETLTILFPSSTNNVVTAGFGFCAGKFDID